MHFFFLTKATKIRISMDPSLELKVPKAITAANNVNIEFHFWHEGRSNWTTEKEPDEMYKCGGFKH